MLFRSQGVQSAAAGHANVLLNPAQIRPLICTFVIPDKQTLGVSECLGWLAVGCLVIAYLKNLTPSELSSLC